MLPPFLRLDPLLLRRDRRLLLGRNRRSPPLRRLLLRRQLLLCASFSRALLLLLLLIGGPRPQPLQLHLILLVAHHLLRVLPRLSRIAEQLLLLVLDLLPLDVKLRLQLRGRGGVERAVVRA